MRELQIALVIVAAATLAGCFSSPQQNFPTPTIEAAQPEPPAKPIDPDALRDWDVQHANTIRATKLLESGEVHSGQTLNEFLRLCTPYNVNFVGRFAFIEFGSVPNLTGLSLIADDGKLVSAIEWGCVASREFFNIMDERTQRDASAAYERRLSGHRRD